MSKKMSWRWHRRSWYIHCVYKGADRTLCGLATEGLSEVSGHYAVFKTWRCKKCAKIAANELGLAVKSLLEDK